MVNFSMKKRDKKDWFIREAKEDDFEGIRALYKRVWGNQRPIGYDKWKYFTFTNGPSQISIAIVGGDIVGAFMLAPIKLSVGGKIVSGGVAMDVMSDPDYVGRPVFVELGKHCVSLAQKRGISLLYGLPNPKSFPGFVKRLNWDHCGDVNYWIRPIKPSKYPKISPALGPIIDLASTLVPSGSTGKLTIKTDVPTEEELQYLLGQKKLHSRKCTVHRGKDWVFSRYTKESETDYRWVSAYKEGKILAAGIWGVRNANWANVNDNRVQITELLGQDQEGLKAVVSAIIKQAHKQKVMLVETITNDRKREKILKSRFFFKYKQIPLIVKEIGNDELPVNIHHYPNWVLFGGDVDTF
ncbi:MAG: hypothetical protein CFH08_00725 [Alphaproteobacteria bacterium MarineAlpha3_Bin7]|nr:MAG: hypothetical protein CFH08_00725 [Alphaproteobacteria bacterium MarineAlpha3_Bin7]|tara:strand:- start:1864 stop:2925 length:1062 start_codon:yes stop_codon:yes gene_type:complete